MNKPPLDSFLRLSDISDVYNNVYIWINDLMHWEILGQLLVGGGFDAFWSPSQWAFDHLNCHTLGNFTKIFQKIQMPRELGGKEGALAVLEWTGSFTLTNKTVT